MDEMEGLIQLQDRKTHELLGKIIVILDEIKEMLEKR